MLMDVFVGTKILTAWVAVYLALPILASSAFNPWVYGYRNSELRSAVRRVVDDFLTTLGFTYHSQQPCSDPVAPSAQATAGDHASFINHVQKDTLTTKPVGEFLLVPIARPESSGILSESETPRGGLKGSRSLMLDTVVLSDGIREGVTLKRGGSDCFCGGGCEV